MPEDSTIPHSALSVMAPSPSASYSIMFPGPQRGWHGCLIWDQVPRNYFLFVFHQVVSLIWPSPKAKRVFSDQDPQYSIGINIFRRKFNYMSSGKTSLVASPIGPMTFPSPRLLTIFPVLDMYSLPWSDPQIPSGSHYYTSGHIFPGGLMWVLQATLWNPSWT